MKKLTALLLALAMVLALAACGSDGDKSKGGSDGKGGGSSLNIDMSKYPSAIGEWTGQNFADYFTEAGAFKDGDGLEIWVDGHEDWTGMPVSEVAACMDEPGAFTAIITILSPDLPDSSQEQYDAWMKGFRENKTCPEDGVYLNADHIVGNVIFEFETTILDDDAYDQMKAAYEYLVSSLGVTPDF